MAPLSACGSLGEGLDTIADNVVTVTAAGGDDSASSKGAGAATAESSGAKTAPAAAASGQSLQNKPPISTDAGRRSPRSHDKRPPSVSTPAKRPSAAALNVSPAAGSAEPAASTPTTAPKGNGEPS